MMDDAQLIRRFAEEQDSAAFGALVEKHVTLVYRTALRLVGGDKHRAVFVLLARKAAGLRGYGSIAGWLYLATRKLARDVRRREDRRKKREEAAMTMRENLESGGDEARADWDRVRPAIDDALGELSAADREAVLLRFFGGKAFGEIGAVLRLSEDAARMRVARALEKLRALLERRGVRSTSMALGVALASDGALGAPAGLAAAVSQGALASAASAMVVGLGAGAGAVGFMGAIKVAGVAALVVLMAFWVVREWEAKGAAERELAALQAECVAHVAQTDLVERHLRAAEAAVARPNADAMLAREKTGVRAREAGDALMAAHPPLKAALLAAHRARIAADAYVSFAHLPLSAEQRLAAVEILQKGEPLTMTWGDQDGAEFSFFIPAEITAEETDGRLRALLGEDGDEAVRRLGVRATMPYLLAQAAGELFANEVPLTAEQRAGFIDVLTGNAGETGTVGRLTAERIERAGTFLSERQMRVLKVWSGGHALRRGELPLP